MVRLDVYQKDIKGKKKLFYVPIYTHQVRKGSNRILPTTCGYNFADNTFTKLCSVYPNDYLIMKKGDEILQGYYIKYNVNNSAISYTSNIKEGRSDFVNATGRALSELYRLDISVLGDNYPWERMY